MAAGGIRSVLRRHRCSFTDPRSAGLEIVDECLGEGGDQLPDPRRVRPKSGSFGMPDGFESASCCLARIAGLDRTHSFEGSHMRSLAVSQDGDGEMAVEMNFCPY